MSTPHTNLFFVSGHVSVIASTCIARLFYPLDRNILISEVFDKNANFDKDLAKDYVDQKRDDYSKILDCLESYHPWEKILKFPVTAKFYGYRAQPIKRIRYNHYIDRLTKVVADELKSHLIPGESCRIFHPRNSYLWSSALRIHPTPPSFLTEHGAAEYCLTLAQPINHPVPRVKNLVKRALGESSRKSAPSLIFLLGATQSESVQNHLRTDPQLSSKVVQLDGRSIIKAMVEHLKESIIAKNFECVREISELVDLRDQGKELIIYLPETVISNEEFPNILKRQMDQISKQKRKTIHFVIKSHPSDPRNYITYFQNEGISASQFKNPLLSKVPAEFFSSILKPSAYMGSYSTAMLYAAWWFDQKQLFTSLEGITHAGYLKREYHHLQLDFDKMPVQYP